MMLDDRISFSLDKLINLLIAREQCDMRGVERAKTIAANTAQRLDTVLIQLGLVSERNLAEAFAEILCLRLTGPEGYPDVPLFPERLKARFLRDIRALPIAIDDGCLVLASVDPLDSYVTAVVSAATGLSIRLEVAVPIELDAALARLYPEPGQESAEDAWAAPSADDAERLKDMASEAPVIRLVNQIVARAVETGASDIHVEPFEDRLRVRFRHDGVLAESESPPQRLGPAIISRIKIMARLDIAERRLPQDGRIKLALRGQDVDFRVSTIPSLHGEAVVLRVLDRGTMAFDHAKLGLAPDVVTKFSTALDLPNGIVLVTGPTGSGKTTTLYSGLMALNAVARKIVTVEDPVEYQLRGINQIQVRPQIGLDFGVLLRSILRQDPDVIMVGEIRDLETAQIAVQAALTGHLVLSTLHTNSAAATITRLRDMGLADYLLTAVLRGVLAQRLLRRLCVACRRQQSAPAELIARLNLDRNAPGEPVVLWHAVGCTNCRFTGYRGRQAVAEFLVPDAAVERLIFSRADHTEIERAAVAAGMVPIFSAGLDAVLAGVTTLEELTRSIGSEA